MIRPDGLLQALGPAGIVGVGVLLACLAFYFSALRPAELELSAGRLAAARVRAQAASAAASARPSAASRIDARFPPLSQLPDQLGRLYALARAEQLDLARGDYRLQAGDGPLRAYRITLPLRGSYPRIREFIREMLVKMPFASIDALQFERRKVTDARLQAQLRVTLYFRTGGQTEGEEPKP